MFSKAKRTYPNRGDDITIQFLLAQVGAGLAFLNKRLASGVGERGGLSVEQFQQAFVWSACFLKSVLTKLRLPALNSIGSIPVLAAELAPRKRSLSDADWESVKGFDRHGLNVLVLSPTARGESHLKELFRLDWTLVVDFDTKPFDQSLTLSSLMPRPVRPAVPGGPEVDVASLGRTAAWYFANGRSDLSESRPVESLRLWRQTYLLPLQELLNRMATHLAPPSVRVLVFGEFPNPSYARVVSEVADMVFRDSLAPIVFTARSAAPSDVVHVETSVGALIEKIVSRSEPRVKEGVSRPD